MVLDLLVDGLVRALLQAEPGELHTRFGDPETVHLNSSPRSADDDRLRADRYGYGYGYLAKRGQVGRTTEFRGPPEHRSQPEGPTWWLPSPYPTRCPSLLQYLQQRWRALGC